jgi:hypothetical protein
MQCLLYAPRSVTLKDMNFKKTESVYLPVLKDWSVLRSLLLQLGVGACRTDSAVFETRRDVSETPYICFRFQYKRRDVLNPSDLSERCPHLFTRGCRQINTLYILLAVHHVMILAK